MSEFNIEVQGGSSVRLNTAGKYCDRDIIVTASGGGDTSELENLIDQSGVLDSTDGTVEEKVERLIDLAEMENCWYQMTKENNYFGYNAFRSYTGTRLPRMDLSKSNSLAYFLSGANRLQRIDFYMNSGMCSSFQNAFGAAASLQYIKGIDTSAATNVVNMFLNCGIKEIEMPLDFSKVTNCDKAFNCGGLVEIRFVAETIKVSIAFTSTYLSAESVQSIIDGLAYVTTSQNLTLKSSVIVTDNQKQVIKAKGWTLIMQ